MVGLADELRPRCRQILMHQKLDELITRGVNFARYPDVVSKVVSNGERVMLYKGVSS